MTKPEKENKMGVLFDTFKDSFSYGNRSDLNFKFLKSLSSADAADFIQAFFMKAADSLNDGDLTRIHNLIFDWQCRAYAGASRYTYENAPFTEATKPLNKSHLALLTSSGHFAAGDDPKPFGVEKMSQQEAEDRIKDFILAEPSLSEIPTDTREQDLRVRHGGYDTHAAQADPNVNFPITRLRELEAEGVIGSFVNPAYSFVGACSQMRLLKRTGPQWVRMFQDREIDSILLVPV